MTDKVIMYRSLRAEKYLFMHNKKCSFALLGPEREAANGARAQPEIRTGAQTQARTGAEQAAGAGGGQEGGAGAEEQAAGRPIQVSLRQQARKAFVFPRKTREEKTKYIIRNDSRRQKNTYVNICMEKILLLYNSSPISAAFNLLKDEPNG